MTSTSVTSTTVAALDDADMSDWPPDVTLERPPSAGTRGAGQPAGAGGREWEGGRRREKFRERRR